MRLDRRDIRLVELDWCAGKSALRIAAFTFYPLGRLERSLNHIRFIVGFEIGFDVRLLLDVSGTNHIGRSFVDHINRHLSKTEVNFDPPDFTPESFSDEGLNLLQINARGRILQIEFQATDDMISTENFRVPHILEGSVRCFNQEKLEEAVIEEQFLFFCLEKKRNLWRFFDARTYRSGPFDEEYLISLMEQLI